MAHAGRSNADDRLAFELATGKSLRDAAQLANVGERTARRRWQDSEFRKVVSRLRADFIAQASGQLANTTNEAVETLKQLTQRRSTRQQCGWVQRDRSSI